MKFQKQPWKHDVRSSRFSHHKFFGTAAPQFSELRRNPGPPVDQGLTLRCGGYGNAFNGFLIHNELMNPDWSAAKSGQKQGRSVDDYGADPNKCEASMCDHGWLPLSASNRLWQTHSIQGTGWQSWEPELDIIAKKYDNAVAYFKVDGPYDIFDNVISTLDQAYADLKQGVDAYGTWYHEWSDPVGGIVPTKYDNFAGYHRYVFFGHCFINGVRYLIAKNSYGARGDNGVLYFPRETVNREFAKWGTTLKVLRLAPKSVIDAAKQEDTIGMIARMILQAWYNLSERFGAYIGLYA